MKENRGVKQKNRKNKKKVVIIYKVFFRMDGAPNENQTHLWRFASLAC